MAWDRRRGTSIWTGFRQCWAGCCWSRVWLLKPGGLCLSRDVGMIVLCVSAPTVSEQVDLVNREVPSPWLCLHLSQTVLQVI